jgi:hypothetical protein
VKGTKGFLLEKNWTNKSPDYRMKLKICPFSLYQNLALVNPRLSISYPDSIKLPYFADFTQRGDRG